MLAHTPSYRIPASPLRAARLCDTSSSAPAVSPSQQGVRCTPSGTSHSAVQKGHVRRRLTTLRPGLLMPVTTPASDTRSGARWQAAARAASLGASSGRGTWVGARVRTSVCVCVCVCVCASC